MLTVVGILLGGVLCGFLLRKRKLKWLPGFITVAIWTLLFALGMAVGSHEELLNHLDIIGWQALLLSAGAVLGSVVLSGVVYYFFYKNRGK
ncbi:LysO family transporter [Odoribacter sp. Z80]|uniref:LysO family transporter n=1 Tax=Odoribacter sp. Z80 TaxID=2304575 RepID=UPI001379B5FA|nr:LysO family transporter [Odoribacter sp. Z80]NCE72801.1 DUF340 domain-containing protein [Odoribacter sp. Z80]